MRGRRREPRDAFIPSSALSNRKGWEIQRSSPTHPLCGSRKTWKTNVVGSSNVDRYFPIILIADRSSGEREYFSYLQFRSIELRINNIELAPFTFPHWLSNYRISRDTRRYSKAIKLLFPSSFLSSRFLRLAFFFAAFSITYRQPLCRVRIKAAFIHFFSFSSINSVYCDKPRSKDLFV